MLRALVVDDEDAVLRMLGRLLEKHGFSVLTANSAAAGMGILAQEEVDIVVTDLRMETALAGFEVVRAANRKAPRPVIVVLTAFPVPSSDWAEAGADALWVKGMDTLELPKRLKALVPQRISSRTT